MIKSKWFIDQVIDWATDNKHAVNPLWLQSKMAEINLPVPTHSQFTGQKEDWGSTHHSPEDKEQLFFPSPASPRVSRITSMVLGFPGFAFILHILILQQISGRCWQNPFSWIRHEVRISENRLSHVTEEEAFISFQITHHHPWHTSTCSPLPQSSGFVI